MKLLEFELIKDKSLAEDEQRTDVGRIEQCILLEGEEVDRYNWCEEFVMDNSGVFMTDFLTSTLGEPVSDDDIFYYFENDAPNIGEEWEQDELVFKRIK